jgi:hypothetical protein
MHGLSMPSHAASEYEIEAESTRCEVSPEALALTLSDCGELVVIDGVK